MRYTALAAIILGFFSCNVYSAETRGENSFFDGLNQIQRQVKQESEGSFPEAVAVASQPARSGRDLTGEFNLAWAGAGIMPGEKEVTELRKYKVLLVRGFMTGGYVHPFKFFGKKIYIGGYFNDQMKVLKALGVDYKMVDVDSAMLPAHNAKKVAREIEASDKPVIIISHSDGGMYVLEALVNYNDLLPKVRGFVPIQAPFLGTPIVDYIKRHAPLLAVMSKLLRHFGGTVDSLFSLSAGERSRFQDSNSGTIREIISRVNIISFASWKDEEEHKLDTLLEIPRDLMLKRGIANDGLTPVESAILPGSDYIKVSGVDHIVTVMNSDAVLKYDRVRLTRTLLLMIISKK